MVVHWPPSAVRRPWLGLYILYSNISCVFIPVCVDIRLVVVVAASCCRVEWRKQMQCEREEWKKRRRRRRRRRWWWWWRRRRQRHDCQAVAKSFFLLASFFLVSFYLFFPPPPPLLRLLAEDLARLLGHHQWRQAGFSNRTGRDWLLKRHWCTTRGRASERARAHLSHQFHDQAPGQLLSIVMQSVPACFCLRWKFVTRISK